MAKNGQELQDDWLKEMQALEQMAESEIEQMEVAACNETTKGLVSSAGRGVCESATPPGRYGSRSAQHEGQDLSTEYVLQPDGEIKGTAKLVSDALSQNMGALKASMASSSDTY